MNHKIQKERIHLFSPTANICMVARINGIIEKSELEKAIRTTVNQQEILCSKVILKEDGSAFFQAHNSTQNYVLKEYTSDWNDVAFTQEQIAFCIDKGETIRFFYSYIENQTELLVIAHHIIGDGNSLIIFMDDLLNVLNQQPIQYKPLQLMCENDLPKHPKLNCLIRTMINQTNFKWSKCGKIFSFNEYENMFNKYHKDNKTAILIRSFDGKHLEKLLRIVHENSLTFNSLIVTAFAAADDTKADIGIAINIRPENFKGMGNYATGISIKPTYHPAKTFIENAKNNHTLISSKLKSAKSKFFLYEFMNAISLTLIDSMYFSLTGLYTNSISESIRKMCGYVSQPTGTSITNLTTIKTSQNNDWKYLFETLLFVPPYIPNVSKVIGASTYKGTLTLTSHFPKSNYDRQSEIFERACKYLTDLVD